MKKYTIEVTERQADVIMDSLEVLARLGIGQFRDALEKLPLQSGHLPGWHDDLLAIGSILSKYTEHNVNGWQSSIGISSAIVKDDAKIAWDVYQVIRKKLSWVRAVEQGYVESETSQRNWKEMMGVSYDDPLSCGNEPLAKIDEVKI